MRVSLHHFLRTVRERNLGPADIALLESMAGFLNAQRWIGVEDANVSVAIYDLDTVDVLASPGYTAIGGQNLSPWSKRITAKSERLLRFEGVQTLPGDALHPTTR